MARPTDEELDAQRERARTTDMMSARYTGILRALLYVGDCIRATGRADGDTPLPEPHGE